MSVVDVLRQKPMVEYIPEAIRKSDGTYRCCCPVHGGDNETSFAIFDDNKFYMNYLDGLTDDMPDEFFRLAQVFELNLFEPVRIDGSSDIYAAYIMNDAVESFFVFEQPVITGTYKDIESEQIAGVEKLEDGYMLIVNQGGENVFTIKFVKLSITSTYFNYRSCQADSVCFVHRLEKIPDEFFQFGVFGGDIF